MPIIKIEIKTIVTKQDILLNQVLKKDLAEKIEDFLNILKNSKEKKTFNKYILVEIKYG